MTVKKNKQGPQEGDLRVWWIPQVPMEPFYVLVSTIEEAALLTKVLADYDTFQFKNRIKPDYSNAGGLQVFEDGEWMDYYDPKTSDDWREIEDSLHNRHGILAGEFDDTLFSVVCTPSAKEKTLIRVYRMSLEDALENKDPKKDVLMLGKAIRNEVKKGSQLIVEVER